MAYLSKKLSPAEVNYEIHDKELLGIIRSLEEWRPELMSTARTFNILTDHKNLEYFMTTRWLSERQVRWSEMLSRFRFQIKHRPGKLNARADALSRRGQDVPTNPADERLQGRERVVVKPEWLQTQVMVTEISGTPKGLVIFEDPALATLWDEGLAQDPSLKAAYQELAEGRRTFSSKVVAKAALSECDLDPKGVLRLRQRIWVPNYEPLKTALIQRTHEAPGMSEHPGRDSTREMLARQFFWPDMTREVCQFCANTCSFGFSTFLPVIIRGFGYSSIRTQLLTVPVYIWASVVYLFIAFCSDYVNRRAFFMVPLALVTSIGYAMMLGVSMSSTGVLYFATFVTATGIYCVVGLNVTWVINSNAGYFKRATAIGLQQTIGNSAGIMAGQIYRITNNDGRYVIGHAISITTITIAACGYALMYFTLRGINKKREVMSIEERIREIDSGKLGDRHPDFRYTL